MSIINKEVSPVSFFDVLEKELNAFGELLFKMHGKLMGHSGARHNDWLLFQISLCNLVSLWLSKKVSDPEPTDLPLGTHMRKKHRKWFAKMFYDRYEFLQYESTTLLSLTPQGLELRHE
jgi:hypothetical protein